MYTKHRLQCHHVVGKAVPILSEVQVAAAGIQLCSHALGRVRKVAFALVEDGILGAERQGSRGHAGGRVWLPCTYLCGAGGTCAVRVTGG